MRNPSECNVASNIWIWPVVQEHCQTTRLRVFVLLLELCQAAPGANSRWAGISKSLAGCEDKDRNNPRIVRICRVVSMTPGVSCGGIRPTESEDGRSILNLSAAPLWQCYTTSDASDGSDSILDLTLAASTLVILISRNSFERSRNIKASPLGMALLRACRIRCHRKQWLPGSFRDVTMDRACAQKRILVQGPVDIRLRT